MNPSWMDTFEPLQSPPPIGWWPPALGWWVVAAVGLAVIVLGAWASWRHRRRNRYRRILVQELDALWQHYRPDQHPGHIAPYLTVCCELIRRTWRLLNPSRAAWPTRDLLLALESTPGVEIPTQLITHIDQVLYGQLPVDWDGETLSLTRFHRHLQIWSRKHRAGHHAQL